MSRRTQLTVIGIAVLVITSLASHLIAWRLKLMTRLNTTPMRFNTANSAGGLASTAGSSLNYYGINWTDVGAQLKMEVIGLGIPNGSVREMEIFQRRTPPAPLTLIGISIYDSNENQSSDFRADIVPFLEEVSRLWSARASWKYTKKVLSQYPIKYIRWLYPTAGRSEAVMVKLREEARNLVRRSAPTAPSEGAVINDQRNTHTEDITAWPQARVDRNVATISAAGMGEFDFHSTKRESLIRFLRTAAVQGKSVLIVLPESPLYRSTFVSAPVRDQFEEMLTEALKQVPATICIRLDQVTELQSDQYYWDFIHLNLQGQTIATKALLAQLAANGIQ